MSLILPFVVCFAAQQDSPAKVKPKTNNLAHDTRPVTGAEAHEVFEQARKIIGKVLESPAGSTTIPNSSRPVTRTQVIEELTAINSRFESKIRFTPTAIVYNPAVFTVPKSEVAHLGVLVQSGFVGKVSPLATNKADSLSLKQFGEILGIYLNRFAELTHMPSPKWSPILGAGS